MIALFQSESSSLAALVPYLDFRMGPARCSSCCSAVDLRRLSHVRFHHPLTSSPPFPLQLWC